ncbi:hypothetical protein WJX81_004152 [Elliptochloris bilobata]|uniref:Uncharacterized protein n=1 Tax=Elliptochloris bilobata TaxID=381761 RepID=A0AAW1QLJ9_9CHLO
MDVYSAASGRPAAPSDVWETGPVAAIFMTHFADLSSWELAQRLVKVIPTLQAGGVQVFAVGLGSPEQGRRFAQLLEFPAEVLFADPEGACHRALGFSRGFAPEARVSPYLKLLPMLAGIGSPGTLLEVIRGYVGDRGAKPVFEGVSPFNVLGTGYQRPFELATLRLRNMVGILPEWGSLAPERVDLLTQQGGALVLSGAPERRPLFRHADRGILDTVDVDALVCAALAAEPQALPGA